MDWIRAISDLLGSVAWPATLIAFLLLFRREISQRLRDVTEVKYPGGSITMREVEGLEAKLQEVQSPAPGPPPGRPQPALPTSSMLAVIQNRLDIERELFLLSRYGGIRDRSMAEWNVERCLGDLETNSILDATLCESVREFLDLSDRLVHEGPDTRDQVVDRAAAAGSSLLATLHQQRRLRGLGSEFEGHLLWHFHGHAEADEDRKYHYWSAVAASLPEFDYNYDLYREASERHNKKMAKERDHSEGRLYILPLNEFISVLEFRERELERIAASWDSSGKKWDIQWRWPEEWGHISWTGPIFHDPYPSLWEAQDELVRTRAALSYYRSRLRQEAKTN